MKTSPLRYRLGLNQPALSPTARRMAEMAGAINRESDGAFHLEVFAEGKLGADPQMFADMQKGALEFYLSGALLGRAAPSSDLPLLPFAFTSNAAVFNALDGAFGDVIRADLKRAGVHAFRHGWLNGFHHITTGTRPIQTADDFAGLRIRTPGGDFAADFFKEMGAEPGMVPFNHMYDALKAKQFDSQSDPLGVVVSLRLNEVQIYLSLTQHWWSGFTLLVNPDAWAALPAAIQGIVERNVETYAKLQRADVEAINEGGAAELERRGMIVNTADTASIRTRLGDFYARWKAKFDPAIWRLLEAHADGLG
jgi:tripartite ATP-independent transporter DctP family solute receptor